MATIQVVLTNGTTADADEVMANEYEIFSNITPSNVASGSKTGSGKFLLDTGATIVNSIVVENPTNTAGQVAYIQVKNGGTTADYAYFQASIGTTYNWSWGAYQNGAFYMAKAANPQQSDPLIIANQGGSGAINYWGIYNVNNAASSQASLFIKNGGTTAHSATTVYQIGSTYSWSLGAYLDGGFYLKKNATLNNNSFYWNELGSGADNQFRVFNANNTASSRAIVDIESGGSSSGDALLALQIGVAGSEAAFGIDNSASDILLLQRGSTTLGTGTNCMSFTTVGNATFYQNVSVIGDFSVDTLTLFVDSTANEVYIGATTSSLISGNSYKFQVTSAGLSKAAFISTDGTSTAQTVAFYKDSSSPANSDGLTNLMFYGNDSGGNITQYATITAFADDVTNGTEDGRLRLSVIAAGSQATIAELDSNGYTSAYPIDCEGIVNTSSTVLSGSTSGIHHNSTWSITGTSSGTAWAFYNTMVSTTFTGDMYGAYIDVGNNAAAGGAAYGMNIVVNANNGIGRGIRLDVAGLSSRAIEFAGTTPTYYLAFGSALNGAAIGVTYKGKWPVRCSDGTTGFVPVYV